jgi:hypothetical protein
MYTDMYIAAFQWLYHYLRPYALHEATAAWSKSSSNAAVASSASEKPSSSTTNNYIQAT